MNMFTNIKNTTNVHTRAYNPIMQTTIACTKMQRRSQSEVGVFFNSYPDSDSDSDDSDMDMCNECEEYKSFVFAEDDKADWPEQGQILDVRYWKARAEREGKKKDQYTSKCIETQRREASSTEKLRFANNELQRHRASSAEKTLLASNEFEREREESDARRAAEGGVCKTVLGLAQNMMAACDKTIDAQKEELCELRQFANDLLVKENNANSTATACPERTTRKRSRTK